MSSLKSDRFLGFETIQATRKLQHLSNDFHFCKVYRSVDYIGLRAK